MRATTGGGSVSWAGGGVHATWAGARGQGGPGEVGQGVAAAQPAEEGHVLREEAGSSLAGTTGLFPLP